MEPVLPMNSHIVALRRYLLHGHTMLDEIDRDILRLLREDGRRTVRDIAHQVGLTVAPVKRRIDRLEQTGVINGYTARVDSAKVDGELEAVVELRVAGNLELEMILAFAESVPEVTEVLTLAGDPDAIARIRAANIHDLQRVVNLLRTNGRVTGTKTLVVLNSWSRLG
ncbi:transcriptional regulator [Mycobacterium sp. JS623]|nr:transcriptional regulator [Mycobacterium sp. JS623]